MSASNTQKLGLVIIAHGSPMPQWNQPVLQIEQQVTELFESRGENPFAAIRVALMEFNEPSVHSVITELEEQGIDKVYVAPLFIAPSGHSMFDIPAILGLYADNETLAHLKSEGTKIVDSKMAITVGPTFYKSDLLHQAMLERAQALSNNPAQEAVILLGHGDAQFASIWEPLCHDITTFVAGRLGMDYANHALVGMGQGFATDAMTVINKALHKNKRVIVVGVYLSMGVERMAQNAKISMHGREMTAMEMLEGKEVVFASQGILPSPRVAQWVVDSALDWLKSDRLLEQS